MVNRKRRSNKKTMDHNKEFKPNKTPKQVFKMGAFGGTYFRPIYSSITNQKYTSDEVINEYPKEWFKGLNIDTK